LPIFRKEFVNLLNWNVTTEGTVIILTPFLAFTSCLQLSQRYLLDPVKSSILKKFYNPYCRVFERWHYYFNKIRTILKS